MLLWAFLVLILCGDVFGCSTSNDCGVGFFCGGKTCVMCITESECGVGCRCSFGSCVCNGISSASLPGGEICETNSRCRSGEYCRVNHCLLNSLIEGCQSTPIRGRCVAAPEPVFYSTDSSSKMNWEVAFAIAVSLLGVLLILLCIALVCLKKDSKVDEDQLNKTATPSQGNGSALEVSRSPPHRIYEPGLSTATTSHGSTRARNFYKDDLVLWLTKDSHDKLGVTYEGNVVVSVEPGGPADLSGMQSGMKIRTIKGKLMSDDENTISNAFQQAVNNAQPFMVSVVANPYMAGDRVEVFSENKWIEGTVVDITDNQVIVLPDGWGKPSHFDDIRKYQYRGCYQPNTQPTSAKDLPQTPAGGGVLTPQTAAPYHLRADAIPTPLKPPMSGVSIATDDSEILQRELSAFSGIEPESPLVQSNSKFQTGSSVFANFNGIWGPAVVVSSYIDPSNSKRYAVDWPDSTRTHDLYTDDLRNPWPVGVSALGLFHGVWYPCLIEAFNATACTYTINWDDKTATSGVAHDDIRME